MHEMSFQRDVKLLPLGALTPSRTFIFGLVGDVLSDFPSHFV